MVKMKTQLNTSGESLIQVCVFMKVSYVAIAADVYDVDWSFRKVVLFTNETMYRPFIVRSLEWLKKKNSMVRSDIEALKQRAAPEWQTNTADVCVGSEENKHVLDAKARFIPAVWADVLLWWGMMSVNSGIKAVGFLCDSVQRQSVLTRMHLLKKEKSLSPCDHDAS